MLGCSERSIRRWEAGKEPEAIYDTLFNWLELRVNEINREEAERWGERVRTAVDLESSLAGLRELLTTPARASLVMDFDKAIRELEDQGQRSAALEMRERIEVFRRDCQSVLTGLEAKREAFIERVLASPHLKAVLENAEQRHALATTLDDDRVMDALDKAFQAAVLSDMDASRSFMDIASDPAAIQNLVMRLEVELKTLASRAPKRRGRAPRRDPSGERG